MRIGTLHVFGGFPGYAWVDEVDVKIPPYKHWMFRCQTCQRLCRSLLWPPRGTKWACGKCHHVRYPDKRRLNTLPPRPDAIDRLDELERDIRRMRLLRIGHRRRRYDSEVRRPDFEVMF
jgi:hypothetical protein